MSYKVIAVQTTDDEFAFPEFATLESNIAITKERIVKGATRVWLRNNRVEVYREHDTTGVIRYFATDIKALPKVTLYCVRLDYTNTKPLRAGCQVGVWVEQSNLITSGLSKDIFWKILFKSHDMITDSIQTSFGRRFWINRLTEAFEQGYSIYSLQYTSRNIKNVKLYPTIDDLEKDSGRLWGPKITDRSRRLMITLHPLNFAGHQKIYSKELIMADLKVPKAWNKIEAKTIEERLKALKERRQGEQDSIEKASIEALERCAKHTKSNVPKAWLTARVKKPTKVVARIDMSAEVAGAGLCPECREPMGRSMANGIDCYVCHVDRIAIPIPDPIEAGIDDVGIPGVGGSDSFGPTTCQNPV